MPAPKRRVPSKPARRSAPPTAKKPATKKPATKKPASQKTAAQKTAFRKAEAARAARTSPPRHMSATEVMDAIGKIFTSQRTLRVTPAVVKAWEGKKKERFRKAEAARSARTTPSRKTTTAPKNFEAYARAASPPPAKSGSSQPWRRIDPKLARRPAKKKK